MKDSTQQIKLPDRNVEYLNTGFTITKYDYQNQYYPYYRSRFQQMSKKLLSTAKHRWPGIPIYSLSDLADNKTKNIFDELSSQDSSQDSQDDGQSHQNSMLLYKDIVVMGTLLKKMTKQPNILKELDDERKLLQQTSSMANSEDDSFKKFIDKSDLIYLQEDDESIELKGDGIQVDEFCTGICMACKGQINPNGSGFLVDDVCFIGSQLVYISPVKNPRIERPLCPNDYHILLVSGLSFCNDLQKSNQKLTNALNILFDLATGNCDLVMDKTIVQIIIAGNSISTPKSTTDNPDHSLSSAQTWSQQSKPNSFESVKLLDKFLANIGQSMFVDVMPGRTDLSTYLWPQQPMHPCLFPKAHRLTTIQSVTNPHRAKYFGVDILGTSGQNVDSIRQCTKWTDTLDIMRQLMEWGHISPTCPDFLHSYPFTNNLDPLALEEYPDVFFTGNQPDFSIGSYIVPDGSRSVRLISIPEFDSKFIGVLLNLRTLDCEMLAFN